MTELYAALDFVNEIARLKAEVASFQQELVDTQIAAEQVEERHDEEVAKLELKLAALTESFGHLGKLYQSSQHRRVQLELELGEARAALARFKSPSVATT
jgi:chromosome segregation ATPase